MATNNGQRVAAFFLALLFLLSTVGATAYVIWQINREDSPIVSETTQDQPQNDQTEQTCGQSQSAAVAPRNIPTTTTTAGTLADLNKVDVKVGEGEEVQAGDCVAALYYGTLASTGAKFDGNYESGQTIEFSLNGVIAGWTEGIPGMKVGGIRRLEIPAAKGYGEQGSGDTIPPNSDLVFEVEIIATRRGDQ